MERIGQAKVILTFDLAKGYWQISLCLEDQAKTGFGTPCGLYKFCRMLFGLNGVAGIFQRLIGCESNIRSMWRFTSMILWYIWKDGTNI